MALSIPKLDVRNYQDLVSEALARVPVHTPEWTNFNESDPGVTLVELFAFLTESLLYRANLIPERNRRKFLALLGVPLQPAAAARGLSTLSNERGPLAVQPVAQGTEVRAGEVPFKTEHGVDVLPLEARAFAKVEASDLSDEHRAYYENLYRASLEDAAESAREAKFYRTVQLDTSREQGTEIGGTIDQSLWIALLARSPEVKEETRRLVAGRVLSLGWVPAVQELGRSLAPGGAPGGQDSARLLFEIPWIDAGQSGVPISGGARTPRYRALTVTPLANVLLEPGVVEVQLPPSARFGFWDDIEPLEPGVGDFPPTLEETTLEERLVTWLRVRIVGAAAATVLWAGINAVTLLQRARVSNESLADGTGEPDQSMTVAHSPILPGSVRLRVLNATASAAEEWQEIDDLLGAGPEVPKRDPRLAPGRDTRAMKPAKVFVVDAEAGEIRFGDGARGARPPPGAKLWVDYDYSVGALGNLGIDVFSPLPSGLQVSNAIPTWGGADAESVEQGEKQIARYLQHRDRLVTATDFETIAWRTPGVLLGRVDVLPAFRPVPGAAPILDAPGAVTLMLLPRSDPKNLGAPEPDRALLDSVCAWLEPRRLVTTELILRGPEYVDVSVSVGIEVVAGASARDVIDAVQRELKTFLSPLPGAGVNALDTEVSLLASPQPTLLQVQRGWPLGKAVVALELLAVASRVPGVLFVKQVLLGARGSMVASASLDLIGLELPRLAAIAVGEGDPVPLDQLQRSGANTGFLPIPVVPEVCG